MARKPLAGTAGGTTTPPRRGPPLQVTPESVEPHPHHTGHIRTDRLIAGAAIFMSLLSLLVAYKHGLIMKDLVSANSWPLLQASTSNTDDQNRPVIVLQIQNVGVGPAIVKSFHAEYAGRRFTNPHDLLKACCGTIQLQRADTFVPGGPITSPVKGTVIKSNEDRVYLRLDRAPISEAVWKRLNQERFKIRYGACYCSVLGTCWESDLTGINPRQVSECPMPKTRS